MTITLEWRDFAALDGVALYEMLRLRQDIFVVEQGCAYPELDGRDAAALHLLLRRDGVLAGYLRLIPAPAERRVTIGRVAVAAALRGHGLAGRLMAAAQGRIAAEFPGWCVTLAAQAHLVRFYQGFGFVETSPSYDDYGISHVDMALPGAAPPSL